MTGRPAASTIWVRTVPTSDGYQAVLEIDDDTAHPLTAAVAHAHAAAVTAAVARAEYDAAVLHQLGRDPRHSTIPAPAGHLIRTLRAARPAITWPTPLTIEPGVSAFTRDPFLTVLIHGRAVGQWTPDDARGHAIHVLEVVEGAALDGAYRQALCTLGVAPGDAGWIIGRLGEHRPQP